MKMIRSMVLISHDPLSIQQGADAILDAFREQLQHYDLQEEVSLSLIEDTGRSFVSPIVIIYPEAVIYGPVTAEDVAFIVEEHLYKGRIVETKLAPPYELSGRLAWVFTRKGTLPAENRIVLRNVGLIDPHSIEDYIAHDGYQALGLALEKTPEQVIALIKESGLQGRGGAGFPAGLKWTFVRQTPADQKYIICNADESEPGTFKDRVILEGDPHKIIEGMAIAGYAVGASEGYIYIRGEYQLAIDRMENALDQARQLGLLGDGILGSSFNFDIHIHSGAGAYVCGEETALIESIEGKRGEPRSRPPYPTTVGLWGKPTVVNNVETLANVAPIMLNGPAWFRSFGTPSSPGTKVYTILGNLNVTGLIEVPMGITLREIINIYGKGMKSGAFKLAQTGGSAGSIIPSSLQDTPMDYASSVKAGVALGSGALLICNDEVCVVDLTRILLNFFRKESCGKCSPCRIGTEKAYQILNNICMGKGTMQDIETLNEISFQLNELSNCGLGQAAAVPLRDMINHFRDEVEAHIRLNVCPAGVCAMHVPALV